MRISTGSLLPLIVAAIAVTSSSPTASAFVQPTGISTVSSSSLLGPTRTTTSSSSRVQRLLRPTWTPQQQRQQHLLTMTTAESSTQDKDEENNNNQSEPNIFEKLAAIFSTSASVSVSKKYNKDVAPLANSKFTFQLLTLIRVGIPSLLAGVGAFLAFPPLALFLCSLWNDAGVFAVLSQDSSQFVQNFLTVAGLLFSILVGQTYYFMYQQQEMVYYALFQEVTEAKSLLEQVALVCQGRTMYPKCLMSIQNYVQNDLKKLQADPAILLSTRPMDDPLESIMYLTSVGVPSTVYETVRSLRQARAQRLGALQRKLPGVHMLLLWILALLELCSFPLLGAGTQTIGGYNVLTVEGCLFGVMTFGIVLTLRVRSIFRVALSDEANTSCPFLSLQNLCFCVVAYN